jgi:hypothetical protein
LVPPNSFVQVGGGQPRGGQHGLDSGHQIGAAAVKQPVSDRLGGCICPPQVVFEGELVLIAAGLQVGRRLSGDQLVGGLQVGIGEVR